MPFLSSLSLLNITVKKFRCTRSNLRESNLPAHGTPEPSQIMRLLNRLLLGCLSIIIMRVNTTPDLDSFLAGAPPYMSGWDQVRRGLWEK
ncbi:hypothetical protein E4T56_gene16119 [Termitomyces sp. T112]|nr:hypothetical protein E4T56_gene16119 [Termitomyces sp. T112]